ncbi:FAD-binding oxidoreductase [Rhodoferax sp. UBA5149]|uniref:FAD-binding oxidoreductase n=1 Tax=Rhodoferax sp. UBA5149 TaxID=1947379 RepID=UPI0025F19B92|nr:FAD-binding oxidoreductase [Rhodoferax sp. UBA5149]
MDLPLAINQWQTLLGASQVLLGEAVVAAYGADTTGAQRHIPAALRIEDSTSLQDVMRIADRHQVPVYPISTGKNWGYGAALPARDGCVILDLSALKKIIAFDAELGVVTLEPGVTQGMLADYLDTGNHPYLVPVTGAGPSCSLVGNALERGYGVTPHVDHFGAVTDLEAVLPDGSLYRTALREAGGEDLARLFKWGIGPYSAGLFTQGGFGIVTRMSIVLSRRPECVKVCFFSLNDDALLEPAVAAIRSTLTKLPGTLGAINLMNQHRVLSMSAPFPSNQLGPDGLIPSAVIQQLGRQYQIMPWTAFATLYGTRRTVAAAQKEMKAALSGVASRMLFLSPGRAKTLAKIAKWIPGAAGKRLVNMTATLAQSLELVAGRPNETAMPLVYWRNPKTQKGLLKNPSRDGCGLMWYAPLVPMRPVGVRAYVDMVKRIATQHGFEPLITLTSISDKLFDSTVPLLFELNQPAALAAAQACDKELLETGRANGWFPYRVGVNTMQTLAALQTDSRTFHSRLRKDLDPHDLMAPGRYR